MIFQKMQSQECEQVIFCNDNSVGLKAIIAIHNTKLGPALGGCRIRQYNNEQEALEEVIKLAQAMSYKAASSGLNFGGGKSVIMLPKNKEINQDYINKLLCKFAKFINNLNGKYITAKDLGLSNQNLLELKKYTSYVASGIPQEDPSPMTALGIFYGIQAVINNLFNRSGLQGITVAIQGLGDVGFNLYKYLTSNGANIIVSDINNQTLEKVKDDPNVKIVDPEEILFAKCDVLAPCAIGGTINENTISKLNCKIIAGGANNQLNNPIEDSKLLLQRNIIYLPDFILNAGGLISVAADITKLSEEKVKNDVLKIGDRVIKIIVQSQKENISPHEIAVNNARKILTE